MICSSRSSQHLRSSQLLELASTATPTPRAIVTSRSWQRALKAPQVGLSTSTLANRWKLTRTRQPPGVRARRRLGRACRRSGRWSCPSSPRPPSLDARRPDRRRRGSAASHGGQRLGAASACRRLAPRPMPSRCSMRSFAQPTSIAVRLSSASTRSTWRTSFRPSAAADESLQRLPRPSVARRASRASASDGAAGTDSRRSRWSRSCAERGCLGGVHGAADASAIAAKR